MHIEFLVEEPSAEAALQNLVPKILGPQVSFTIHPYQGKLDLLARLPGRLKGYRPWLPDDWRIVVLVDADEGECRALKGRLEQEAHNPDDIKGGTWEALERELQRRGYFHGGLAKIQAARAISAGMEPVRNRSRSFQVFRQGLLDMTTWQPGLF